MNSARLSFLDGKILLRVTRSLDGDHPLLETIELSPAQTLVLLHDTVNVVWYEFDLIPRKR